MTYYAEISRLLTVSIFAGLYTNPDFAPIISKSEKGQKQNRREDLEILAKREFLYDPFLETSDFNVIIINSTAELSGLADSLLEKERAIGVVKRIKGITTVVDKIQISIPSNVSERRIIKALSDFYIYSGVFEGGHNIKVTIEKPHKIVLSGTVRSYVEKKFSEIVAKKIRGVGQVENNIKIDWHGSRSDQILEMDLNNRIKWNYYIDHNNIAVEVNASVAKASGVVGSSSERAMLYRDLWVAGVKKVDISQIRISKRENDALLKTKPNVTISDSELETIIRDVLSFDQRFKITDLGLIINDGNVTIGGQVRSVYEKMAVSNDLENTLGVNQIINNLSVLQSKSVSDKEIARRILVIFNELGLPKNLHQSLQVKDGIVTINGPIQGSSQFSRLAELFSYFAGVRAIKFQQ